MIDLNNEFDFFTTKIFLEQKPEWLNSITSVCNSYIDNLKKNDKIPPVYHSENITVKLPKFFIDFIINKSFYFWEKKGYDLTNFKFLMRDCWVQEFNESGEGHHESHIHSNNHVSGFYFLKCSEKSSFPIFHDPRLIKTMMQLPEKNDKNITNASKTLSIKPFPGLFVFFPSYLSHQFALDINKEPFMFIHFNGQFLEKEILK